MPIFVRQFAITPAESRLLLSRTTGVLSFALLFSGVVSDLLGRKRIMMISLVTSALLTVAGALSPTWQGVPAPRILMGLSLSGVQAVAMA